MKWIKRSDHAITDGKYIISRCFVNGVAFYVCYEDSKRLGQYPTPEAAKTYIDSIREPETGALL